MFILSSDYSGRSYPWAYLVFIRQPAQGYVQEKLARARSSAEGHGGIHSERPYVHHPGMRTYAWLAGSAGLIRRQDTG